MFCTSQAEKVKWATKYFYDSTKQSLTTSVKVYGFITLKKEKSI